MVLELVSAQAKDHQLDDDSNGKERDESLRTHALVAKQQADHIAAGHQHKCN